MFYHHKLALKLYWLINFTLLTPRDQLKNFQFRLNRFLLWVAWVVLVVIMTLWKLRLKPTLFNSLARQNLDWFCIQKQQTLFRIRLVLDLYLGWQVFICLVIFLQTQTCRMQSSFVIIIGFFEWWRRRWFLNCGLYHQHRILFDRKNTLG